MLLPSLPLSSTQTWFRHWITCSLWALIYLPTTIIATDEFFNKDYCLNCVSGNNDNMYYNTTTDHYYCGHSDGTYICVTKDEESTNTYGCTGNMYAVEQDCIDAADDSLGSSAGKAFILTATILSCCCCTAIVACIAGCIYCCIQGSGGCCGGSVPLPNGIPGAYQTNPRPTTTPAPAPVMMLPGMVVPTPSAPTLSVLAATPGQQHQPPYQPSYQEQSSVPFAEAVSLDHDYNNNGNTKR
jgi:hypothetical protein